MYKNEKELVLNYFQELEQATPETIEEVFKNYMTHDYHFRGVYPWREQLGIQNTIESFWKPFLKAIKHIERRQDIFIGGTNEVGGDKWVMSMGHFVGLFDEEWLNIKPTGKMIHLRYAEFSCVNDNKISKTGLFVDVLGFMKEAGITPIPYETGSYFIYPGPKRHNGLLFEDAPTEEGITTLALVNKMVDDLSALNESGAMGCPPEVLEKTWSKNMIWYGPCGIGASYTIPRYQVQHQLPFRNNLADKKFNGHVCRFSEGTFACFFGWPNLSNRAIGGFLGLPESVPADMQVVDVYSRYGEYLEENWVFIDIPYWLKQQGVDIIERTTSITNPRY